MIYKYFEVLENAHKIVTHICSFKEYFVGNIRNGEEFYVGVVSTFVYKVSSMTNEERKK
jgi:hypothetical protein